MKPKRPKVIKAKLEKELLRYNRRIQKLASEAYQLRMMLDDLNTNEAARNQIPEQGSKENALHNEGSQGQAGSWTADSIARQPDISDNIVAAAVLAEQPAELRNDIGDAGKSAGSGV